MSNSFDWQRDFREGIREGTTLRLLPLDDGKEAEFTVIKETGRGSSVITYEVLYKRSVTTERCYLKELYPEHICENENLFRTSDGVSLKVSHGFDEEPVGEKDFSLIDSKEGIFFIQDYKNIKELRLKVDSAPLFVCDAQEIYRNESTYYVKVPFETNETLKDYIDKTNINLIEILLLGRELALMTQKLHEEGYLHLDIKPENLLCKSVDKKISQKTLSFLDTGTIARIDDINKIKYLPSSSGYSSPEQEFLHKIDSKHPETTDIFSIGAVIFKMLTGEKPSEADCRKKEFDFTKNKTLYADCKYSMLSKLNVLLCKTLSVSPSLRFHSCEEVVTQIQSVLNSSTNPFDRAIDRMHIIFPNKPENKHVFFSWGDETFEKDMFPQVSYGISNERYDSLYELICDYRDNKRLFWLGGQGGCGKSAHLKRLAYDLYNSEEKLYAPIYIDSSKILDTVKNDKSYAGMELKTAICKEIEMNSKPEELEDKFSSLKGCRFAIIIDGLNELDEERKNSLLNQIDNLSLSENSIVIVSDRGTPYYNTEKCVLISINPFDREFIKTRLNQQNGKDDNLIDMLCGNIYLFKKFRTLKETDRTFKSSADILSSYYDETVFDIISEIRNKKKTTDDTKYKKELVKSLACAAFDSSRILTLTVDKDSFCHYLKEDSDYIDAVKKSKLFVRSNGNLKFEHETIRDFIISFYLKEVIIDCCSSDKAPYNFTSIPDILSSPLPDDTLKYLGELLYERIANNDKHYDAFCNRLIENRAKPRGNNITEPSKKKMVRWDASFEKQGRVLAFALYSLNCSKHSKKAQIIANIIKAMALGRGYRNAEDLIRQTPVIKKLLLYMIVDSKEMESVLPGSQNYIGTEALKRRKQQFIGLGILIFLFVFVFLPASVYSYVPRVEIDPTTPLIEGAWCINTEFNVSFTVKVKDKINTDRSLSLTVNSLSEDDFIMEGFTADLSAYSEDGEVFVSWKNTKPVDSSTEVTNCSLKLKEGAVSTLNTRKNKETEICSFKLVSSPDYEINTIIYDMDVTAVEPGGEINFKVEFSSKTPFTVQDFSDDLVLNNFSANVEIDCEEYWSEDIYVHCYKVQLKNIQSINDDEKNIYIPSGTAKNDIGVYSFSKYSDTIRVSDNFNIPEKPKAICELIYDEVISPGASIMMLVDFSIAGKERYDFSFLSEFTTDSFSVQGFTYDESVYIGKVSNNAHEYMVLFSNVFPDKNFDECTICINEGWAVAYDGQSNAKAEFTFNPPFSDEITDLQVPNVTVSSSWENEPNRFFNNENMFFDIDVNDNCILPDNNMEHIKNSIKLLNADYDDIIITRNGGWDTFRSYRVEVTNISPKASYESVEIQILPGAISDSFGNLSEEIRIDVFTEESLKKYSDYKRAINSPDILRFDENEIEFYANNQSSWITVKADSSVYFDSEDFRTEGFSGNIYIVRDSDDEDIMVKLTNIQLDEGVDSGTLIMYAIGENRTVYKASITVKKSDAIYIEQIQ